MRAIELIPDDDIVSVLDRLGQVTDDRVVFLVPPPVNGEKIFSNPIDLVRLRRAADGQRRQVGLVTDDALLRAWAHETGLPVFASIGGSETDERTWRRGRRVETRLGLRPEEIAAHQWALVEEKRLAERRRQRPVWEYWLKRYLAIIGLTFLMAALVVAAVYFVPRGEIVLQPATRPVQTSLSLAAATDVESEAASAVAVPARIETVVSTWTTAIATTGSVAVPDAPARGQIVLTNLTVDELTLPAGTLVWAENGPAAIEFQIVQPVVLPAVVGATAAVDIVALEAGETGNVPADAIRLIENQFAEQVELRNPEPTTGGAVRPVPAVSPADRERLRAQLTQYLQGQAIAQLEGGLADHELLARETLRLERTLSEDWSHAVGQPTDSLSLELTAEVSGVIIDTDPAVDLVYNRLTQEVPPGYTLLPDSFDITTGEITGIEPDGTITFVVDGVGQVAAIIDPAVEIERVAGHKIDEAMIYLQETLLLDTRPTATVSPNWLNRLPYLPSRITVVIDS